MTDEQEIRLMRGLCARDAEAWRTVYNTHAQRVWRDVAHRLGVGSDDVADVVQEIFLDAARSAHGFKPEFGNVSQWLSGITRRKVALYWRRQSRRNRLTRDEISSVLEWLDGGETPERLLESAELVAAVRRTLHELPDFESGLLRRKYQAGETAREIAEQLGVTVDAIQSRLKRAKQQFRTRFTRLYGSPESQPKPSSGSRS